MISSPIFKNTMTNYMVVAARLLQGLLVTRWLWNYLGEAGYGFWALLWAIFAYVLLFDFGFGISAQKYTADGLWKNDVPRYNRIISAIFSFHALMSLVIIVGTILGAIYIGEIANISDPSMISYCRTAFLIFGIGSALAFPTGIFPEMLAGLHKLYLRNYINTITKLSELAATFFILKFGGGVISLAALAIALWIGANLSMALLLKREIPGWKILLKPDWKSCKEIANFSIFAYLTALAFLIREKSNHIIIGMFLGLSSVGIYNLAGRIADLCFQFTSQYQENIRPITATLYAQKDFKSLKTFIFNSIRINCFFGVFLILPAYIFIDEAMAVLFKADNTQVIHLARLCLILALCNLIFRQVAHSFLLMGGKHQSLSAAVGAEAVINLISVIVLVRGFGFGVDAVIYSTLAVNLLISCAVLLPFTLRHLNLSFNQVLLHGYLLPLLLGVLPGFGGYYFRVLLGHELGDFWTAAIGSTLVSGSYTLLFFILAFSSREKKEIIAKILARSPLKNLKFINFKEY